MTAEPIMPKLYIHETVEITVKHRQDYLEHFLSWAGPAQALYGMRLYGVWAVNGSTHRWPEAIILWEHDGLADFANMLKGEYAFLADPALAARDHYDIFWSNAPAGVVDLRGADRLLIPSGRTQPLIDAIASGLAGSGYLHQTFTGPPGSMVQMLDVIEADWAAVYGRYGLKLCGAFRTMLVNDSEAIAIWAIDDWHDWARLEAAQCADPDLVSLRVAAAGRGVNWEGKLLNPANRSPLQAGLGS